MIDTEVEKDRVAQLGPIIPKEDGPIILNFGVVDLRHVYTRLSIIISSHYYGWEFFFRVEAMEWASESNICMDASCCFAHS